MSIAFLLSNLAAVYASGIFSAAYMSSFIVLIYGCIWSTGDCYESKAHKECMGILYK